MAAAHWPRQGHPFSEAALKSESQVSAASPIAAPSDRTKSVADPTLLNAGMSTATALKVQSAAEWIQEVLI
jgi:hypothetical protein